MSEEDKERAASFIAKQMPAWWRPEYQSAKGQATVQPAAASAAATVPPVSAPVAPAPATTPEMPPAPQPPATSGPPAAVAVAPASPAGPPSQGAKTMVLGTVPTAPPIAILIVTSGPDIGFKFRIKAAAVTCIGRETDNDVVLDDPATSRHHAEIKFQDGKYVLTDLGSINGTLVNDQRVTEHALADGDLIKVGQNILLTSIKGPAA